MKLTLFLVFVSCLFLEIFAKVQSLNEFVYKIGSENSKVDVEPNSLLILEFGNNSSVQEQWIINNLNEIYETGLVEYKSIQYRNDCETGCGETSIFTFQINNVTNQNLLPTLKFSARSSSGNTTKNVEVILNLIKIAEESNEISLNEYTYAINEDTEIVVSNHSLIKIEIDMDLSGQYEWLVSNVSEIENSGLVKYNGNDFTLCGDKKDCTNKYTFTFTVGEIDEGDELPKLKFSLDDMFLWKSGVRTITVTLKREGEINEQKEPNDVSEVCTFKDYPCCTKANPKVYYHDKDGDWGVEKGNWCFIMKKEEDISTCQPKDGYPVCKTTKKVVYTDSDKWGVEHNQWCILCN